MVCHVKPGLIKFGFGAGDGRSEISGYWLVARSPVHQFHVASSFQVAHLRVRCIHDSPLGYHTPLNCLSAWVAMIPTRVVFVVPEPVALVGLAEMSPERDLSLAR